MSQPQYELLVFGFDAVVTPTEDDYHVTLLEGGRQVFDIDIPVDTDLGEDGIEDTTEDLIFYAAQAAVDIYEANRGTLGQGGGATEKKSMKRKAYIESMVHQDWFCSIQGTEYEAEAVGLLEQLFSFSMERGELYKTKGDLQRLECQILNGMNTLNLERWKMGHYGSGIVVVLAHDKAGCFNSLDLEEFLCGFEGCSLEQEALAKAKELIECQTQLQEIYSLESGLWDKEMLVQAEMDRLSIMARQQGAYDLSPASGVEAFPTMADDVAELMEGVSVDEPLKPMMAFNEEEDVQVGGEQLEELGEKHEGLDPAEMDKTQYSFNQNERVELKEELEVTMWGGIKKKIPKGTKGYTESQWDKHGDYYLFRSDTGHLFRVHWSKLKSTKK